MVLRDRLTAHEAVQLGAQLPMLIRGVYYENWHLKDAAPAEETKSAFLGDMGKLREPNLDADQWCLRSWRTRSRRAKSRRHQEDAAGRGVH